MMLLRGCPAAKEYSLQARGVQRVGSLLGQGVKKGEGNSSDEVGGAGSNG